MADDTLEIDIHLRHLRNFFSTPEVDPFEGEHIDEAGIDQIIDELRAGRIWRRRRVRAVLHVPAGEETASLAPRIAEALVNYCDKHVQYSRRKLNEVRADGLRALAVGVLFLALCIGLAGAIEKLIGSDSLASRFLVEGAIIAGWVGLWRPIEILLFDWWPYALDVKLYGDLRAMDIVVRPV
ncbi:hypothetical protein MKI84_16490 [Ancylobacter sp. A5.8]|uniref:hypothetical protein n=1 Tax=Ancylobacter gelatini TaxID=2919920 RepID=UPI001F4E1A10|nr:hypothetical protein [Ancylobacter gelatini]MCJ8144525.1 hypothetical protein [Ancylobacter gelatini]